MSSSYSSLADWNKEPRPSSSHLHRTPKAVAQQHPQFHDDDAPGVHPSSDVFAKQYAISKGSYDEFSASHNSRPKPTTNPASPIEEDSDNDCDRVNSMLMLTSPDRLSVTATPTDGESSFHQEQSGWNASHAMSVDASSSPYGASLNGNHPLTVSSVISWDVTMSAESHRNPFTPQRPGFAGTQSVSLLETALAQASQDSSPATFASIPASGVTPSSTLLGSAPKKIASPERENVRQDMEYSPSFEPTRRASPSLRTGAQALSLQARTLTATSESSPSAKQIASFAENQVEQYQQDETDVVMNGHDNPASPASVAVADSDSETLSSRSPAARGDLTSGQPTVLNQKLAGSERGLSLREASSSGASTLVDMVVENPLVNPIAMRKSFTELRRPETPLFWPSPSATPVSPPPRNSPSRDSPPPRDSPIIVFTPEQATTDLPPLPQEQPRSLPRKRPVASPVIVKGRKISSSPVPDSNSDGEGAPSVRRSPRIISISSDSEPPIRSKPPRPHKRRRIAERLQLAYVDVPPFPANFRREDYVPVSDYPGQCAASRRSSTPVIRPQTSVHSSPSRSHHAATSVYSEDHEEVTRDRLELNPPLLEGIGALGDDPLGGEIIQTGKMKLPIAEIVNRNLLFDLAPSPYDLIPRQVHTSWKTLQALAMMHDAERSQQPLDASSSSSEDEDDLPAASVAGSLVVQDTSVPSVQVEAAQAEVHVQLPQEPRRIPVPPSDNVSRHSDVPSYPHASSVQAQQSHPADDLYLQQHITYQVHNDPYMGVPPDPDDLDAWGPSHPASEVDDFPVFAFDGTIDPSLLNFSAPSVPVYSPPTSPPPSPSQAFMDVDAPSTYPESFSSASHTPDRETSSEESTDTVDVLVPIADDSDGSDHNPIVPIPLEQVVSSGKGKERASDVGFRARKPHTQWKDRSISPADGKRERRLSQRMMDAVSVAGGSDRDVDVASVYSGTSARKSLKSSSTKAKKKTASRKSTPVPRTAGAAEPSTTRRKLTREDIETLAHKPTFCHHCRRTTKLEKMRCTRFRKDGSLCGHRFCINCITKRYPEIVFDAYAAKFECPKCLDTCNCTVCSRKRGEEYVPERHGGYLAYLETNIMPRAKPVRSLTMPRRKTARTQSFKGTFSEEDILDPESASEQGDAYEAALSTLQGPGAGQFWGTVYDPRTNQITAGGHVGHTQDHVVVVPRQQMPAPRRTRKRVFIGAPATHWRVSPAPPPSAPVEDEVDIGPGFIGAKSSIYDQSYKSMDDHIRDTSPKSYLRGISPLTPLASEDESPPIAPPSRRSRRRTAKSTSEVLPSFS